MTQKEVLENVLAELVALKKGMPNGEFKAMIEDMKELREDVSELKYTLLNPEDGVIVKTNKNTWWREQHEEKIRLYDQKVVEFENLQKWQQNVTRALWIAFAAILGIALKMIFPEGM